MMKVGITENGVMIIYNTDPNPNPSSLTPPSILSVKVQVIYFSTWNSTWFIRVTDAKYLSPVMVITEIKGKEKIYVGDIILIKQVEYKPSYFFDDMEEILPFIDSDFNHIIITDYDVAEKRAKIGLLCSSMTNSSSDYSYWNDLALIRNCNIIVKGEAETIFKESEKRVDLVGKDCNILRERGNDLFNQKNLGKAIIHYEMAKQIDYYDARVWNNSSQAFFSNDEFIKAKKDALIALKLDPFNKKAYYRAGRAMEKAGDLPGATEIIEAGLYLCGKCDDLEKLLKNIKDSNVQKPNKPAAAKKEENQNQNLNLNNSKKKITNGEAIDSVPEPAITNGNIKKNTKPKESPHRKNKDTIETKPEITDLPTDLLRQKEVRNSSLFDAAKLLYKSEKYKNSLELYQAVNISHGNDGNESECAVVRYLIDVCKIKMKMEPLRDVKNSLLSILGSNHFPYPPAIHFWLAGLFEILEDQDKVVYHANSCLYSMQEKASSPYTLFWPGSNDPILETSPKELKKWFDEGSWRPAPLARCRHKDCISIQNHNLATIDIFSSDLDFRGYVEVECEEMCSICFHPGCWKSIKEQSDGGQSGKKAEKDFLGSACLTPDCSGKIVSIRIFDEMSQLKNEISKDKKDKKTSAAASKLKKKKDKKKTSNQVGKPEEKKKFRPNDLDDFNKLENDIEIIKEETATFKPAAEEKKKNVNQKLDEKKKNKMNELENCNFEDELDSVNHQNLSKQIQEKVIEQVNFEGSNFKVLKPCNSDLDEFNPSQTTKKNKTKKKKRNGKPVAQIPIGEEIEDRFAHNEYLTRLRALKSQTNGGETEPENAWLINPVSSNPNNKHIPECVLDPERPFYLPQHLQENPAQLETLLRNKIATSNSSDIDKENITTLLEFMYDWLKAEKSPMLISDTRIKDCITDNFPSNAVSYVNKCGSITNFLLQSYHFALIDDVVCVNEQVQAAQEVAIQLALDKFKISKYLISDGHRAVKLSHLLDDTKSTCSSNSSMSTTRAAANPVSSSEPLGFQKVNYAFSATPYKQAALAKVPHKEPEVKRANVLENDFIKVGQNKSKQKMTRKPKLKTMDIDVFDDELEPIDMGQLFSQQDKGLKTVGPPSVVNAAKTAELYFHSDEELENDIPAIQISNKGKLNQQQQLHQQQQHQQALQQQQTNLELKERISILESELSVKMEQINKLSKEKELLTSKNQELNERCSQMKVKSSVEIAAWKKSSEDAKEQSKVAETNLECFRNQKEGEVRKLLLEKSRLQEELKTYSLKVDSQLMTLEQLSASKAQYEEKMKQNSIQFAEQQIRMMKYKNNSEAAEERARDAEIKYLTVKRDLIKMNLEKTKKRLTAEVNKMQELLYDANDLTQPSKGMLTRSLKEWEETIVKLNNTLMTVHDDGQKLVDCIQLRGQSLSSLPPGDLQIPSVPDLTVAHLLFIGRGTPDLKGADKVTPTSSTIDFLGLSNNRLSGVGSSLHSQFGSMNTFSLGQLGITPNAGTGHGTSLQQNELQRSMMGATSGLRLSSSRLGDLGLEIGSHVNRRVPDGPGVSSGFSMNGVSPLSSLIGEDLAKGGSSESSPIPSSITSMSSLSGTSDFTSSYYTEPKNLLSGDHLFGNHNPWSFADNHHIKPIPPKHPSSSVLGPVSDHPLIPSSSNMSSLQSSSSSSSSSLSKAFGGGGGSAFGLLSLLDASNKAEPRTVATPTTPTATKPKFQNLRSNDNIGAIGALPPKVVRPVPRPGAAASAIGTMPSLQAVAKEEQAISTAAYRKLIEGCKQKFGNEYAQAFIQKAIREVREHNKNSLSGLTLETILDQVEAQLRMHKRLPPRTSVAPWAQLTQQTQEGGLESQWQGPVRGNMDSISEDHCAICLERLASSPTMPLPCLHEFHIKCIKNWLVRKSDCPICRKFALNSDEFPSLSGHGQ